MNTAIILDTHTTSDGRTVVIRNDVVGKLTVHEYDPMLQSNTCWTPHTASEAVVLFYKIIQNQLEDQLKDKLFRGTTSSTNNLEN